MQSTETAWRARAACKTRPDLFHAPALDYDRSDEDYENLSPAEHKALEAAKAAAEEAAVDFCFGCPVMQECDEWALRAAPHGVAGGRTAAQRAEMRATRGITFRPDPALTATLRDRGPRLQIDDTAVARLTARGTDSKSIAETLGCSERTVVRARARIRKHTPALVPSVPAHATGDAHSGDRVAVEIARDLTALGAAVTRPTGKSSRARGVSPSMAAIYEVLADGGWHRREALLAAGTPHISDADALAWWTKANTIVAADGEKVLNPAKASTPRAERISLGAREKVNNMLSASCRNGKHTERGGPDGTDRDLYRLAPATARATATAASVALTA